MDARKKLFKLDSEDLEESDKSSKSNDFKSTTILTTFFSNQTNFLNQFLACIPSPEEELEELDKDNTTLEEKIKEAEESLQSIEERIKTHPEDSEELKDHWEFINSLLESYEYDLKYNKVHKKSLTNLYYEEDDDTANKEFTSQLPELFVTTFISTKKKMEDVNQIVDKLKKDSIKAIEECIYCNVILKDDKGRKTSKQHFHLNNESFLYYHPVICVECIKIVIEDFSIEFKEEEYEGCCKKGSKIYSNILINDYSCLEEYITKLKIKEKEKNKENIMIKAEKDILDL
jgi:hypothetical protein